MIRKCTFPAFIWHATAKIILLYKTGDAAGAVRWFKVIVFDWKEIFTVGVSQALQCRCVYSGLVVYHVTVLRCNATYARITPLSGSGGDRKRGRSDTSGKIKLHLHRRTHNPDHPLFQSKTSDFIIHRFISCVTSLILLKDFVNWNVHGIWDWDTWKLYIHQIAIRVCILHSKIMFPSWEHLYLLNKRRLSLVLSIHD